MKSDASGHRSSAHRLVTLTTVGALGVNLGSRTSFDIAGSEASAFSGNTLYGVNLTTGALTSLGMTDRAPFGIAIAPVPEPSIWAMMIGGLAIVSAVELPRPGALAPPDAIHDFPASAHPDGPERRSCL